MKKHTFLCPTCHRERELILFFDVYQENSTRVDVLAACKHCNKGTWVNMTYEDYEKEKKEQEDIRKVK